MSGATKRKHYANVIALRQARRGAPSSQSFREPRRYNAGVNVTLVRRLDAALPQTQCTRCGFADCLAYAEAIAQGAADVNRCPPGGEETIARLAALTGMDARPLDPACGTHAPLAVALIDESRCIGCAFCLEACPVDAILGASKRMHFVVPSLCSGCELCLAPCPVDCIAMVPAGRSWSADDANAARVRHRDRAARLARGERIERRGVVAPRDDGAAARRATVQAALERARARRAAARSG
jgi:electron transport complex protein RnfB